MAKPKNTVVEPVGDRAIEFMKFAGKEMVDAFDNNQVILAGEGGDERFNLFDGAVLVVAPVNQ